MLKNYLEATEHTYRYWKNKPILGLDQKSYTSESINDETIDQYRSDIRTKISDDSRFEWIDIDLGDEEKLQDICTFLGKYYSSHMEEKFRFTYTPDYIRWRLGIGGRLLGIIFNGNNKEILSGIVGISFRTVQISEDRVSVVEPSLMCIHPKFREKGMANVLMDETIRISSVLGMKHGLFCTNSYVPTPTCSIRYFNRPLNYRKLVENEFIDITNVELDVAHEKARIKLRPNRNYRVAEKTPENVQRVYDLFRNYSRTFYLSPVLTLDEVESYFFDDRFAKTVFIYREDDDVPIDFITYHTYDILNTENNNSLKAASVLMYSSIETRPDLLIINLMKQLHFERIDTLYLNDSLQSSEALLSILKEVDEDTDDEDVNATCDLHFIKTSKKVHINLFNWRCERMKANMACWLLF